MMNESTTTRVTATVTIDINQFENIKFDVDVDLADLEGAKNLVRLLHRHFHKLCEQDINKLKDKIVNDVRVNNPVDINDYQAVTEELPFARTEINEAKKEYKRSGAYKRTLQPRTMPDQKDEAMMEIVNDFEELNKQQ